MKWRRGLIFAGIHIVVAIPLIVSGRMPRYPVEGTKSLYQNPAPRLKLAAYQEGEQTVEPVASCGVRRTMPWQESFLDASELPAALFSGWDSDCPPGWTTAGMIGINVRHHTRAQEIRSSAIFCLFIAIQWVVVGGLPLIQPRRWWLEPGSCNTASTLLYVSLWAILELISAVGHGKLNANVGILFALVGFSAFALLYLITFLWFVWVALLLWKSARSGWRFANQL